MILKNWKTNTLFWATLLLLFLVFGYQKILFFEPHSMHMWRQADCISLSMNFMEEKNPFQPSIHNYIADDLTSGRSAGEFTGVYYLMGRLWEIFGIQHWMYRLFNVTILAFACFSLFKTLRNLWQDIYWSLFLSLLVFASPLIVFYAPNFLMDLTALSFTIWGWSLFIRYLHEKKNRQLYNAFLLFTLAALFKVTAGISVIALLSVVGLEALGAWRSASFKVFRPWRVVLTGIVSFLLVFGWYYYASVYNDQHGGKYTFNDLWPLWEMTPEHFANASKFFHTILINEFFQLVLSFILITSAIAALVYSFFKSLRIFLFLLITITGSGMYIIFWFGAIEGHDYYFINLFTLVLLLTGVAIHYLRNDRHKIVVSLKVVTCLAFIYSVFHTASGIRMRYSTKFRFDKSLAAHFYSEDEILYWTYMSRHTSNDNLYTIEPYNRKLGIKRSDLVIVLPDESFNIDLIRMNQKGWTNYGTEISVDKFNQLKTKGAKYLFLNKTDYSGYEPVKPILTDSIGYYEGYTIYKL